MLKIGSHNTFTYLKPKHWWMYPFRIFAKCQSKGYKKQYEKGIRYFDLRIKIKDTLKNEVVIAHGLMEFKTDENFIENFLIYLSNKSKETNEDIYVRVVYEMSSQDTSKYSQLRERAFINFCLKLQEKYSHIHFVGGNRKYDWKGLVKLEASPCVLDMYSSMTWKKWDDWCPFLYAFFMNKKNREKYKDSKCILLQDFI